VDWIHDEVSMTDRLPMGEVEGVVRSLSVACRWSIAVLLPLLDLKRFDQYTTTHACNVSVLAMGLAERLGLGREEVRSFGVAACCTTSARSGSRRRFSPSRENCPMRNA
jgi:HD-GYP domain-containing protein (c-di-GMP phosphodiesterase class II)